MLQIAEMIEKAKTAGYNEANAEAKVCQDIVLMLISKTSMSRNITVKGGGFGCGRCLDRHIGSYKIIVSR